MAFCHHQAKVGAKADLGVRDSAVHYLSQELSGPPLESNLLGAKLKVLPDLLYF